MKIKFGDFPNLVWKNTLILGKKYLKTKQCSIHNIYVQSFNINEKGLGNKNHVRFIKFITKYLKYMTFYFLCIFKNCILFQ